MVFGEQTTNVLGLGPSNFFQHPIAPDLQSHQKVVVPNPGLIAVGSIM